MNADTRQPESVTPNSAQLSAATQVVSAYRVSLSKHSRIRRQLNRVFNLILAGQITPDKGRTLIYALSTATSSIKAQADESLAVVKVLAGLSETQLRGMQSIMADENEHRLIAEMRDDVRQAD